MTTRLEERKCSYRPIAYCRSGRRLCARLGVSSFLVVLFSGQNSSRTDSAKHESPVRASHARLKCQHVESVCHCEAGTADKRIECSFARVGRESWQTKQVDNSRCRVVPRTLVGACSLVYDDGLVMFESRHWRLSALVASETKIADPLNC